MVYLTTIHRRCLFCFVENRGGLICFEGRSQTERTDQEPKEGKEKGNVHNIVE